jgi:hypothetical protein
VWAIEALGAFAYDLRAGGASEFGQFGHRFGEVCAGAFAQFRADEEDSFGGSDLFREGFHVS